MTLLQATTGSPVAVGVTFGLVGIGGAAVLAVRAGVGTAPDWGLVAAPTAASAAGGIAGARSADRIDTSKLSTAFTVLVLGIAACTATQALPAPI